MSAHVRRINRQDRIATGVLVGIAAFVMLMLAAIVIYILVAGAPKLFDLNFLTGKPQQFKEGGGIGPELFNSFYLLILTLLISVPLSLGAAIFLSQYAPDNAVTAIAKTAIETLSSLPSVVPSGRVTGASSSPILDAAAMLISVTPPGISTV